MGRYLTRLQQSADDKKKASATTEEAKAKATLKKKQADLESQVVTLNAAYEDALGAVPFNVDKILSLTAEKAQNQADLDLLNKISTDEFGA